VSRVPGTYENGNGPHQHVPPDLPYPCVICTCSGEQEHTSECDGSCETWEPTETQVKLQNISREFRRHGLDANSVSTSAGLTELFLRIGTTEKILCKMADISEEEYNELYREEKILFLQIFLDNHLQSVKKARTASALGIIDKKVLGPDGKPIG